MSKIIKKRRNYRKPYSVLICKPHKIECQTDERTSQFIMKAFERGTAEYWGIPSKTPELARNRAINKFLHDPNHKNKTHLFFLDDDSPPWEDYAIEMLRAKKKPVIAGVTPIVRLKDDSMDCMWSAIIKDEDDKPHNVGIDELPKKPFKAYRAGGTCMLIERKVLEKLDPPYQQTTYNESVTDVALSEDIFFTDKIRKAGFDIWVDPDIRCHHFHLFDLLDIFAMYLQREEVRNVQNS